MKLKKFNEMWDPMGSWDPKQMEDIEKPKEDPDQMPVSTEYLRKLPTNPEKLTKALDEGLDPTILQNFLLRICLRDNLIESINILIDRIKEFNYGNYTGAKLHILKHTSQYGRIKILNKFNKLGFFDELSDRDWEDLLIWLNISRQLKDSGEKEKVKKFLLDIKTKKKLKNEFKIAGQKAGQKE
jgi:hypothetical protein